MRGEMAKLNSQYQQSNTYDPSRVIGIDPMMGDLLFEPDEIPLIRGGWLDRNSLFYSDDIESGNLRAVNIIRKGTIDSKNRNN